MDRPATSPRARSAFESVRATLLAEGATTAQMMGMPVIYFAGLVNTSRTAP
jgi:hypothetical protein